MDPRDLPPEHGSTVLPGVPLPPRALPHGPVAPEGAAAPDGPPEPVVEPFPGAEPRPAMPATPAAAPSAASDASTAAPQPAAAPPKVPWWKREIGGSKAAPPAVPAADAGPAPDPSPPPASTPPPPVTTATAPRHGRHAAPEPEPQDRRTLMLLLAVGAALVALAVALFVWPGFLVGNGEADAGSGGPTPTAAPAELAVPDELAGLPRLTGASDAALQERLTSTPVEGLSDPVGAVYGTGGTPSLQVIAWRAVDPPAQDAVEAAFAGFEGSGGAAVSDVQELPAGDLGGHMACGATTVQQADAVQCFWADASTFGSVTVLAPEDRPSAHATALAARAGVETR